MGMLTWLLNLDQAGGAAGVAVPTRGRCQTCGKQFDLEGSFAEQLTASAPAYFFSSAIHAKGSYVSAETIILAGETILTCPFDEPAPYDGRSPSGADLRRGDDRRTHGDTPSLPGGPLSRPVSGQS